MRWDIQEKVSFRTTKRGRKTIVYPIKVYFINDYGPFLKKNREGITIFERLNK